MRWCLLVVALGACGSPYGECAGGMTGTFDGAGGGTVTAQLSDSGDLTIALVSGDGTALTSAVVPVEEDGSLATPTGQSVRIEGDMDLETCAASGIWASLDGSGSWEIPSAAQ